MQKSYRGMVFVGYGFYDFQGRVLATGMETIGKGVPKPSLIYILEGESRKTGGMFLARISFWVQHSDVIKYDFRTP